MSREPTFQCACGVTVDQAKRGRARTRCKECDRKHKLAWMKGYHAHRKAQKSEQPTAQ